VTPGSGGATGYWLFKTEPASFSWEDLGRAPRRTTVWDGVRNYQARNFLRDEVRRGDGVLFYHSGGSAPAAVGTATVVRGGYPDPSQFDPGSPYYDSASTPEHPRWYTVDVRMDRSFRREVPLAEMRGAAALAGMKLLERGSRLSILPVTSGEWWAVLALGGLSVVPARRRRKP
jgi:predicted RNA-binding protein with PUA-like domain